MEYTENDKEWLELFDKTNTTFKWFFDTYFESEVWEQLILYRNQENIQLMMGIMNNVWYMLPDHKFNIIENPKGWSEFLTLIEL